MPHASPFALLAPVIVLLTGGLAALGAEPFLDRQAKHGWLPWLVATAAVVALLVLVAVPTGHLHGILMLDAPRQWMVGAVLAATAIAVAGLQQTLSRDAYEGGEPYALTAFAAVGVAVMVMAADLVALFVGLEVASLSIYALVGLRRERRDSNEGLFKYFVMGGVFSAIFLYGVALTYGATGSTAYGVAALPHRDQLQLVGTALVMLGLLFKVGAVPFHTWSPDAYTGAPVAVTGFMGSVMKVGGFAALGAVWLNLVAVLSSGMDVRAPLALDATVTITPKALITLKPFAAMLVIVGLVSLIIGNFSALRQTSVRRLVAFSSVAHAGYMLFAFALPVMGDTDATIQLASLWYYVVGYAIATAGALTAVAALSGAHDAGDQLHLLAGQGRAQPLQGLVLTVFVASFAGLPPTMGFVGKFLVLGDFVAKGHVAIAVAAMLAALVGAGFYLRLLVNLWAPTGKEPTVAGCTLMTRWAVSLAAVAVVVLMACPGAFVRAAPAVAAIAPAP